MNYIPGVSLHARHRMAERHGRDLTEAEWLTAVMDILDGRAKLLQAMPGMSETYLVIIGELPLRLVWRPELATVMTVLGDRMQVRGQHRHWMRS